MPIERAPRGLRRRQCHRRRPDGAAAEGRHVASGRKIDLNGVEFAAVLVIAADGAAQTRRFHAHDRVALRVEIVGAAERFHSDGVALDAVLLAAQRRLDDVAQKRDELRGAAERFARRHMAERRAHFIGVRMFVNLRVDYGHRPGAFLNLARIKFFPAVDHPRARRCVQRTRLQRSHTLHATELRLKHKIQSTMDQQYFSRFSCRDNADLTGKLIARIAMHN